MGLVFGRRCSWLHHCGASGAQVTFSSVLPVEGNNTGRNRWAESISAQLLAGVIAKILGFLTMQLAMQHQGCCIPWWNVSFLLGEESLCSGSSRAHWQSFTIDVEGDWDSPRLVAAMTWDEMQRSEGQSGGKGPLLLSAVLVPLEHTCNPRDLSGSRSKQENTKEEICQIKEYSSGKDWFCNDTRYCESALNFAEIKLYKETCGIHTSTRAVHLSLPSKKRKKIICF